MYDSKENNSDRVTCLVIKRKRKKEEIEKLIRDEYSENYATLKRKHNVNETFTRIDSLFFFILKYKYEADKKKKSHFLIRNEFSFSDMLTFELQHCTLLHNHAFFFVTFESLFTLLFVQRIKSEKLLKCGEIVKIEYFFFLVSY